MPIPAQTNVIGGALGLLLGLGALVAFDWALYEIVQTGTCASGGPYVSARQCPEGTGLRIAGVTAALPVGLLGCGLLSFSRRGNWRAASASGWSPGRCCSSRRRSSPSSPSTRRTIRSSRARGSG